VVALVIASVVFVNVIIYTLTSFFGLYLYTTDKLDFSIGDSSEPLFADAIEKGLDVKITFCMYEENLESHPTGAYVNETAKAFKNKYPDFIELEYVNISTQLDSEGNYVDLSVYKKDMRGNDTVLSNTSVIFSSGNNYRVITDAYTTAGFADFYTLDESLYMTSYNGEELFAAMISWVLNDDHGVAYFTIGHGETASINLYNLLACAGYYVEQINLRASDSTGVPDDADLVVISNPTTDFERAAAGSTVDTEMDRLADYASRGGCFFVTVDPYSRRLPVFYDFLADYGISMLDTAEGERQTVKDDQNAITTDGFTIVCDFAQNAVASAMNARTEDLGGRVILRDVAPLKLEGAAEPLLITSPSSVCHSGGETSDTSGSYPVAAYSVKENYGGESAKLFFIPSIYIATSDAMISNGYLNKDFLYSLFDVFYGADDLPYGTNVVVQASTMLENLTLGTSIIYTAILLALPVVLAAVGLVTIIRRKNR
jgi:hypothetical protein